MTLTTSPDVARPGDVRPASPQMLNHLARVTHDAAATADFYENVMGMPLVNAFTEPAVPSTGDPYPYIHIFHRMLDGSTVAFFESPGLPTRAESSHPAYDVLDHLALLVDSIEDVDAWMPWLHSHGIETVGPVNHPGICYSLYFRDPVNDFRLEVTFPLDPRWNSNEEIANLELTEWKSMKKAAEAEAPGDVNAQSLLMVKMIREGKERRPGYETTE